ncbi:MAG: hypothetical protein ACFFD4_25670 [Candidatus Odinarchaeota archaeon]
MPQLLFLVSGCGITFRTGLVVLATGIYLHLKAKTRGGINPVPEQEN